MEKTWFKCTVTFNNGSRDRSQRYFLVEANTKSQAIGSLLEYMEDNHFLTVNLSGIRLHELQDTGTVIETAN